MPGSPESHIVFRGAWKRFDALEILKGVDLDVRKGQTLVIIGGSGTGKSVTLKLMIGLLSPDAGQVLFDGRAWKSYAPSEADRQRQRFGFVFQGGALFDSLNIIENVAFPLREHTRKPEQEILAIARRCLESVGLTQIDHKFPAELSGGMRKRVSLARALSLDPEILLYDEPTTGLDPINSQMINELIERTHHQRHVTSVVVTHDMQSAFYLADIIVMLYKGRFIFRGTAQELKNSTIPEVRRFIEISYSREPGH